MPRSVLQTFPLGFQWPTIDPFLFCVHHLDLYGEGNEIQGPVAALDGRDIGQDFEGIDGWRMYHGSEVPGFPGHPHRGFETVTFVRHGLIDHFDSMGASARYGRGDVQWLTAGRGMVHSETFPLVDRDRPNPTELFQIWVNLPSDDKLAEPFFSMLWSEDIPQLALTDAEGRRVQLTVVAGPVAGVEPPSPPPSSWAARPDSDVAIWHLCMEHGARWTLPAAATAETVRTLYVFEGDGVDLDSDVIGAATGAVVSAESAVELTALGDVELLVLQGRPIGEPVAQYGPFVMNNRSEIEQAFADYRTTGFGGWPWPSQEPVNAPDAGRFARRPDGTLEVPATSSRRPPRTFVVCEP
jgi:hypothetical protein